MYIRRSHRRKPNPLPYAKRWEVAYELFFNSKSPKDLSYEYKISLSYISRIKTEFIEIVETWKGKTPPEQISFKLRRERKITRIIQEGKSTLTLK